MNYWQLTWSPSGGPSNAGELLLWCESSGPSLDNSPLEANGAKLHPHAQAAETLAEQLKQLDIETPTPRSEELLLPTIDNVVQTSFNGHSNGTHPQNASLEYWTVPVLPFDLDNGITLLSNLFDAPLSGISPAGISLADSTRFWAEGLKFVLDLLTRGRFLPVVRKTQESYESFWQLVFQDPVDMQRLRTLTDGIPGAAFALSRSHVGSPLDAESTVVTYLNNSADLLIRGFLSRHSLCPEMRQNASTPKLAVVLDWLKALTDKPRALQGPLHELANLEQRLKRWSGPLVISHREQVPVTYLRLIAPDRRASAAQESNWLIEFGLHPAGDLLKTLSAANLKRGELGVFRGTLLGGATLSEEELEEYLLKDLGRASLVCPPLARSLRETFPTHLELSTEEAYMFLKETAPALEQQGFSVFIPEWWKDSPTKLGLQFSVSSDAATRSSAGPSLGVQQLVQFSWQVALGEEVVTLEEFQKLVAQKVPLVKVRGQWVDLDPVRIEATLRFLDRQNERDRISAIEALRIGLGAATPDEVLPVVGFKADGWIEQLLNSSREVLQSIQQPESFIGQLRAYQIDGVRWLAFLAQTGTGGCLADDMGLGKTIQFLALLLLEQEAEKQIAGLVPAPTLLIAPMSIIENWKREAARFAPSLKVIVHHGPERQVGADFTKAANEADLVITTYSLAYRDEAAVNTILWKRIALDEAQNIKNLATKQTQSIRRISQAQLAHPTRQSICQRLALTGTPLENHLEELWSIFDFLNPGYLGTLREFRQKFAAPIERYRDKAASEVLSQLIRPFLLRRLKRDPKIISDLPEKIEMQELAGLTKEQSALYQSTLSNMLPQVDRALGIHRKGLVLATITKLKQICNHPALYLRDGNISPERSGKLTRLHEMLEELLAEGDKVLIFTQFAQMGEILKNSIEQQFSQEVLFLHGGLQKQQRSKLIDRFQAEEKCQVFVLSLMAGGFGINLTAANQVIHYDQWWNPAVEEQATDRAYRIGQKRTVQVRKFMCRGTLEERIAEMLERKRGLADEIVHSTKSDITELDARELRKLLELSADTFSMSAET